MHASGFKLKYKKIFGQQTFFEGYYLNRILISLSVVNVHIKVVKFNPKRYLGGTSHPISDLRLSGLIRFVEKMNTDLALCYSRLNNKSANKDNVSDVHRDNS